MDRRIRVFSFFAFFAPSASAKPMARQVFAAIFFFDNAIRKNEKQS